MEKEQNPFAENSSQNRRINIKLENFNSFFHKPSTDEESGIDLKYIERRNPIHQLKNWIKYNVTGNGAYLVTGYRGAGKSSLVGKVLHELKYDTEQINTKSKTNYLVLHVNLGQENIEEKELFRIIVKMLRTKYARVVENNLLKYYLRCLSRYLKENMGIMLALLVAIIINKYKNSDWSSISSNYWLIGCVFICIVSLICNIYFEKKTCFQALEALNSLCERLNATVTYKTSKEYSIWKAFKKMFQKDVTSEPATIQEIEFELIEIFDLIRKSEKEYNLRIVIVIDELDKAETSLEKRSKNVMPEYEKLSLRPNQKVSSRTRKEHVLSIIANMKYFLSTAKAYFIFIAGRELYEAFQADMSDRDFTISSIFSGVINVDSFLISSRYQNNTSFLTEQFICKQIMPQNIEIILKNGEKKKYSYDKKEIYSLKNYYAYRMNMDFATQETIWRDVYFLNHFANYLSYISNGSPKKMALFFEKNIREEAYLFENKKIDKKHSNESKTKPTFYLSFGYYTQQKINFVHYMTYPIMQSIINRSNMYGDKLLVSSSFLISHIFKYHNNGFSWRNLEQTPELLEINKTPEIREFISSIIDYLNHTHLTTIPCGLYHYKFPMRITEEISYYSKVSGEVSALFNFSPDEMQAIKDHYLELLSYHKDNTYVKASIHHSLGDLCTMEENYSQAIREYETCIELTPNLDDGENKQPENYLIFLTRTKLKLGLVHEKRRTDNSAFIIYNELISSMENTVKFTGDYERKGYGVLFENMRIMHLAILAKLYVLEKIDTDGIQWKHIVDTLEISHSLLQNAPLTVKADFYRKLGDILYYKNCDFANSKTSVPNENEYKNKNVSRISTAFDCYLISIEILLSELEKSLDNKNVICQKIFNSSSQAKDFVNRDNYLYHLALACEDLGHVSYAEKFENCINADLKDNIFVQLVTYIEDGEEIFSFVPSNGLDRAILYYWSASRLYNASCERGLAGRCFIEIMHVVTTYIGVLEVDELGRMYKNIDNFVHVVANHYLISKYRQYEHIHLSEINSIKWVMGLDIFQYIQLSNLSITPDVEEIIYVYYTIKLSLIDILKDKCKSDELKVFIDIQIGNLSKFYNSEIMTGKLTNKTLTSTILNLRLKTRINEVLLSNLLKVEEEQLSSFKIICIKNYLTDYKLGDNELIKCVFRNFKGDQGGKLDLLSFLISDGLFCLSKILEIIIPLRNTTLFNNSFKGDIYYHMINFNHLYKLLYCCYKYGKDGSINRKIDVYLNENEALNYSFVEKASIDLNRSEYSTNLYRDASNENKPIVANERTVMTYKDSGVYKKCFFLNDEEETSTNEVKNEISIQYMQSVPVNNRIAKCTININNEQDCDSVQSLDFSIIDDFRRKVFEESIHEATKKSNPSNTLRIFLAENAIHYYTKARQVHNQGKSYQEMIRNLHFLDDDLNNNTCQFYMAEERFFISQGKLDKREQEMKRKYSKFYPYDVDKYFNEQIIQ